MNKSKRQIKGLGSRSGKPAGLAVMALCLLAPLCFSMAFSQTPPIPAPEVAARSWILMDATTGKVIAERESNLPVAPASLTKVMTGYVAARELASGRISLEEQVMVSVNAWRTPGSRMFIQEGTEVSVADLLRGIIIQSGNDASVALAEHIAGSEASFATMMNQSAADIGMTNSHFRNTTGLPDEDHYSTAADLAMLAQAYIREYPENYQIYSEKSFKFNDIEQPNRNRLLWRDRSVDGIKTGYTRAAGYCLLASAERDGMRLIAGVMGARSDAVRVRETQKLLTYGFRFHETRQLYAAGVGIKAAPVWYGETSEIELAPALPVHVTISRGSYESISVQMVLPEIIEAPVSVGEEVGSLEISLAGELLETVPLTSLTEVPRAGFFSRLMDFLVLTAQDWFGAE